MRLIVKTPLLYYIMYWLAWQKQLNAKNIYIYAIVWGNEQLAIKINILEFENKILIAKTLKIEKQKKNRGKRLNLLGQ